MELDMTKGAPLKLIIKFMIPLVIGNVFQQFYSMTDTILVGNFIGVNALAAVGATGTIMFLILGFIQGLTTGFTVLTSQRYGAGDQEAMRKSVGNGIVLSGIVIVIFTIVSVMGMDWLLQLMNTPEDIYDDARTYIIIICYGIVASVLYNMSASVLRAIGNSKVPLYFLIMSAVLNIGLDVLFIKVFSMGVAGAGWATVLAQGISGLSCIIYIWKKVPVLALKREDFQVSSKIIRIQLRIGIPMALQFSITAVGTIMVQSVLNMLGSTAVAAYTAASKIEQLVTQPFFAAGFTMATYGGQNKGVNQIKRIRQGVNLTFLITSIYAVIAAIFVITAMPILLQLFIREDYELILPYATTYITLSSVFYVPLVAIFVYRNVLQGCGFAMVPMLGGVVELVCRMVVAIIAARLMSFAGVCLANGVTWLVTAVYLIISYFILMRREQDVGDVGIGEVG